MMSSYSSKDNHCRNFSPNIFNKNKCQNCFKPRETHLLSDKDLNKAEPIYCGWLLLAPIGTDFDNPTHRSRKWQRRYFVLFEHGALRYALDDNANTLPQGTINMNNCSDVVHGEVLTGQKHSICIFLPDMKYFLRSENRDDATGWFEQLIVFPETAKLDAQRKKRTAKRYTSLKSTSAYTVEHEVSKVVVPDIPDGKLSPKSDTGGGHTKTPSLTSPDSNDSDKNLLSPRDDVKRGRRISRKATDMKQSTQSTDYNPGGTSYVPLRRAKSLDREAIAAAKELLHQRKGWLMKYFTKENCKKHWFVLTEDTLRYYKDPASEDAFTDAEGELNLMNVEKVSEVELSRNYGFSLQTGSEEMMLAAVTSGIRRNWLNSILKNCKPNIQLTKAQAYPELDKTTPSTDLDALVEIKRQRRARIRDRRKMGRSRTYDFAELRSASKSENVVECEIKLSEYQTRKTDDDVSVTEIITSPKMTPKRNGLQTTEKIPINFHASKHSEPQWMEIENYLNSTPISASAVSCLNSLKTEVDSIELQLEKSKQEHVELLRKSPIFTENDVGNLKSGENPEKGRKPDRESDNLKTLEISYKISLEENKRLKDEMSQSCLTSQQETSKLQDKISELKNDLAKAEKRAFTTTSNRSNLKSDNNERSFKARVSELEAEMEDTGQMLAARLSALENPRRRDTDESDEVGSNSSCSSISLSSKQNKDEALTSRLRKKGDLDSTHQRLAEVIKALQEAREAAESSTSLQESLYMNKSMVISLQKKMTEDEKKYSSVRQCLHELRSKVAKIRSDKYIAEPLHVLPFLESVLDDTLQTLDTGYKPHNIDNETKEQLLSLSSSTSSNSSNKSTIKVPSEKEIERLTLDKLKTLSDQLKNTGASMNEPSSTAQVDTTTTQLPTQITGANIASSHSSKSLPIDLIFSDQRANLLAEQLSLQAMVVAQMATSLERYNGEQGTMQLSLRADLQGSSLNELKSNSDSELLQHAGILTEKLLLEGHFMRELSNFRISHARNVNFSNNEVSSSQNVPVQGDISRHHNSVEDPGSLSLIQAQVNYLLHIYNDRISRLSQDVKEAQHRADVFQQKLHELVHACKTQNIELVSQLAVEVDTRVSFAQTVEDLPLWRQQVDYGMLHGAQAGFFDIDLRAEATFFSKLAQDVSCMSTDMNSLASVGGRILELDTSLSRILKPSEIGEHASIIAYEAISQAQLLFLCKRISKDYEAEITKMKSAVKQQSAHCDSLKRKLNESENGDATRMQELTSEHKQKVERLRQQLEVVEKARYEMESEMDDKLSRISHKQQREIEKSSARHTQETEGLRSQLNESKELLEQARQDYLKEIDDLKHSLERIKEGNERQISQTRTLYEDSLANEKKECQRDIDGIRKANMEKLTKIQADFEEEIEMMSSSHKTEILEIDAKGAIDLENLEDVHAKEIESLKADKVKAIDDVTRKWEEILRKKEEIANTEKLDRSKTETKQEEQMNELHIMFERSVSDIKHSHKQQLDELAEQYQVALKNFEDEKAREMDEDVTSTKLAIMSMRKHFQEELQRVKSESETLGLDESLHVEMDDLKRELEALSELYTTKCVDYTQTRTDLILLEDKLQISENNTEILKEQNDHLSNKFEDELTAIKIKVQDSTERGADDDLYHLHVQLSTKEVQIAVLKQQMESFKQQVAMTMQGRNYPRHSLRRITEADDLSSTQGYGIIKSKSHPDFISFEDIPSKTSTKRSSDRSTFKESRESPTS